MTALYISKLDTTIDNLNRFVTTLTQEITASINEAEENLFISTLKAVDEREGCIEYHTDFFDNVETSGSSVNKAIEAVNNVAGHTLLAPVTKIEDNGIYKVEILH